MAPSPLRTVALAFLCFWIGTLAHEGAHVAVFRAVYGTFRVSEVDAELEQNSRSPSALPAAAGPAMSLLILVVTAVSASGLTGTGGRWVAAMMAGGAASRFVLTGPSTLLGIGSNDEQTIGRLLNTSARAMWIGEAAVCVVALWWIWRHLPSSGRSQTVRVIGAGVVLGWISAVTFGRSIGLPI